MSTREATPYNLVASKAPKKSKDLIRGLFVRPQVSKVSPKDTKMAFNGLRSFKIKKKRTH